MSDANLASLASIRETALGVPGASPHLQLIPFTGESLTNEKETVTSATIRSDRQIPDSVKVGEQPQGGINFELSFAFILPHMEEVLQSSWSVTNVTASLTFTSADQKLTGTAGAFTNVIVGQMLRVTGTGNQANRGTHRVVAKAANGSWVQLAAGSIAANETTVVTAYGKAITNGIDRKSRLFEKRILNGSGEDYFQYYKGMVADTLEIKIESKKIVTGSLTYVGTVYDIGDDSLNVDTALDAKATNILTATANFVADDAVTVGDQVYIFKAVPANPNEVDIGVSASVSLDNLIAAITAGAGSGTAYGAGTVAHTLVTAAAGAGDTMTVTAIDGGSPGNAIVTTETSANASFSTPTLTGGGTPTGSPNYLAEAVSDIMNASSNMGTIQMDNAAATDKFKTLTIQISNNLRGKDAIAVVGNFDIGSGTFDCKGSFNAYFQNNLLPAKIKSHTSFGLGFFLRDATGNELHFFTPNVKPQGGDPAITAINTDVMIETSFQTIMDRGATGRTLIVDALAAP